MINNQNVLLTGSEGLIGKSFVEGCKSEYKNIFSIDIKKKKKKNYFKCDITKENQVEKTVGKIIKKNNVDILINNASNNPAANKKMKYFKFTNYKLSDWNKNLSTDLVGSFLMSKYVLRHFEKRNEGTIINISSIYGLRGIDQNIYSSKLKKFYGFKPIEYSVAKAGILGFTKSLASYYKKTDIKILCLILGGIEFDQSNLFKKNYNNKTIINRMAMLNEYNEYLKFFSSKKASYSSGTCVIIDGGATSIL
tara:strand:+ start:252 stop:1004 length:753 start_codon:yes stop_codon:yes gene_type:complete